MPVKDIKSFPKKKKKSDNMAEYNNLPKDEKQKFVEYTKKYYKMKRKALL